MVYIENPIKLNIVHNIECLEGLKQIPDECIDCVITSPPYWALRDYGVSGQLGLEPTFQEYINKLCDIFDEIKRVLKKEGTVWVNVGDTYYSSSYQGSNDGRQGYESDTEHDFIHSVGNGICLICGKPTNKQFCSKDCLNKKGNAFRCQNRLLPSKCLCQIPSRFAIEMCNRGWILRNEIIWHKPNCMPSSVKDRFTVDFEKIFFFTKSKKYYFETQYENLGSICIRKRSSAFRMQKEQDKNATITTNGRNKRAVWRITTKPYKEAHFATYPEEICETPIKAGCPQFVCKKCGKPREKIYEYKGGTIGKSWHDHSDDEKKGMLGRGGIPKTKIPYEVIDKGYTDCGCNAGFESGVVLDPFMGSGTTALVALKLNRKFIGFEINQEYIKLAEARIKPFLEQKTLVYLPKKQDEECYNDKNKD